MSVVLSVAEIRSSLGEPSAHAAKKVNPALHPGMIDFIAMSPLALISSVGEDGFPTISPRGDDAGFIQVKDERTLYLPERKGNKLAFTLQNILKNDKIALIFIVPNTTETLRVSGTAEILNDPQLNSALASATQPALLVIKVTVHEAYFHCAKSFLRSGVWNHDAWEQPLKVSLGAEIARGLGNPQGLAAELDTGINQRYRTDL
jgi:PPOX class probable FMN-dependent enzyme